jgi:hypothetical protein
MLQGNAVAGHPDAIQYQVQGLDSADLAMIRQAGGGRSKTDFGSAATATVIGEVPHDVTQRDGQREQRRNARLRWTENAFSRSTALPR